MHPALGWLEMEEDQQERDQWISSDGFGIGTGVELLAEGAGHLLKRGSERLEGEENRTGAEVRAT